MVFEHDKMAELRLSKKWSQEQLADKLGLSRQMIALWEKGKSSPRIQQIGKIAAALGVEESYIVREG